MGNTDSCEASEADLSSQEDLADVETCLKLAAIYWTRIAKKEGFQTAFIGTTAARVYGSQRIVTHIDVLIDREFWQSENGRKLRKVMEKHADKLAVTDDNTVMVKVGGNKGVILRFCHTDDEKWTLLVPASEDQRDRYNISSDAVPTYSEWSVGYEEPVPVQFAPNLLISKLRGFTYQTCHSEREGEMEDINAIVEWMIRHDCRFGSSGSGASHRELPQVRSFLRWCHHAGFKCCDLDVINRWRQLGFPLDSRDVMMSTNRQRPPSGQQPPATVIPQTQSPWYTFPSTQPQKYSSVSQEYVPAPPQYVTYVEPTWYPYNATQPTQFPPPTQEILVYSPYRIQEFQNYMMQ
jgi:hypothetical protein